MQIQHVAVHTHHLAAQRDFYVDRLGFTLIESQSDAFTLRAGASMLTFRAAPDAAPQVHHIAFNVPEHRFDEVLAWTRARVDVLPFQGKPYVDFSRSSWNAHSVYFEDAGGHIMEFIARHNLPAPASDADFSPAQILSISEIGLASDDQPVLFDYLTETLGLPVFDGGRGSFAALGDDTGLLILVNTGRAWMPTEDRLSVVAPVDIALAGSTPDIYRVPGHPYEITMTAG